MIGIRVNQLRASHFQTFFVGSFPEGYAMQYIHQCLAVGLKIQETKFWLGILKSRKVSKRNLVHFPVSKVSFSILAYSTFCFIYFVVLDSSPLPTLLLLFLSLPLFLPSLLSLLCPPWLRTQRSPLPREPCLPEPLPSFWHSPTWRWKEGENFVAFSFITSGLFFVLFFPNTECHFPAESFSHWHDSS